MLILEIVAENIIPNSKAKELLEAKGKEGDLKYEQKNSLEILRKIAKVDSKKIDELMSELSKIEKLRDRQIISIVNFLPGDKEDLRAVLNKDYSSLTDDEIESVISAVKKHI